MDPKSLRNPTKPALAALIRSSKHQAARRLVDPRNGDLWYWPAEAGTHREGADFLGITYDQPPGAGDIVTL